MIFDGVGALLWRQFSDSFVSVSMDNSSDHLHVMMTFIHTTLARSLLRIHPEVPFHYRVVRGIKYNTICYIRIDTLDIKDYRTHLFTQVT